MQHKEYWAERFEKLTDAQLNKGTEYYYNLQEQYRKAIANIEKDIAKWYTRYATENGITLTEAKRLLNGRELAEFRMDVKEYIEKGKSLDPKWAKQLEAASTKVHVSRLEALKVQMQQQAEMLYSYERDGIDELARSVYTDGYYHTAYEIQKGIGVGFDLMQLDANRIDKLISKPWATDGKNFSERIWNNRAQLVSELENRLTQSIIRGQSPKKVIAEIAERFNVNKSRAGALVMTESAFFASASQRDAFNDLDVEKYEILATLDSRTSETCRYMDGKVIPMKDYKPGVTAPPFHVRCRSTTVPFFDDEFTIGEQRAARGEDGKYYTVPASMKYKDWENAFVKGGSKDGLTPVKMQTENGKRAIITNTKSISSFGDLEAFMQSRYSVNVENDVKNLNFKAVKQALAGVEKVGKEVPEVLDNLKELVVSKTGMMSCNCGAKISFNPAYFKDRKLLVEKLVEQSKSGYFVKNGTIESLGVHEAAHGVEWVLIDKNPAYSFDFEKILAWNDCTEAKKIVSQACKNIKKTPFGKGKRNAELIETISRYAKKNESETLAEAFADIAANGKNASPLSVEIKRLTLEQYRKYKGVT